LAEYQSENLKDVQTDRKTYAKEERKNLEDLRAEYLSV
jgi:hypothetical protein